MKEGDGVFAVLVIKLLGRRVEVGAVTLRLWGKERGVKWRNGWFWGEVRYRKGGIVKGGVEGFTWCVGCK